VTGGPSVPETGECRRGGVGWGDELDAFRLPGAGG
jgi:hypothetical protein